jgi:tRNA threonylcarbamoyl adenosine modification protein YjeE
MVVAEIPLPDAEATARFGADIAMALRPGDVIGLSGELGAGKTSLARGLIRHLAADPALEIPSPTFTLCQTYETVPPIAHFDLYRISDAVECAELGLGEFAVGVTLVEWPEHAGDVLPAATVIVRLQDNPDGGRIASIGAADTAGLGLLKRLERSLAIRGFLARGGHANAARRHLQGDASTRRYEVVETHGATRILMDAPRQPDGPPVRDGKPYSRLAHLAEDVVPFVAIAGHLRGLGFSPPQIFAADFGTGLLLLEHLGADPVLDAAGAPIPERYVAAARLLARLHRFPPPERLEIADDRGSTAVHVLPRYDAEALGIEVSLFQDWYLPHGLSQPASAQARAEFDAVWTQLFALLADSPPALVLRDYHSPNLIWRGDKEFPNNLGLIDFQDAVIGPAAYDLASLGQDARVDIHAGLEEAVFAAYLAEAALDRRQAERLRRDYAILAAQRATKILGIFVRLNVRDGKPGYLRHIPRLLGHMERNLRHPALSPLRAWWLRHVGPPERS